MSQNESIVLGGGCFWCLDAAYPQIMGVIEVISGYTGGPSPAPSYEAVSSGTSGHVEVVKVIYDPAVVSLEQLLAVFWSVHDPTSLNRQGADVGTQYASAIFYDSDEQKKIIETSRDEAQTLLNDPIVTRLEPLDTFYEAEQHHQGYYANNPTAGYCTVVIEPKLQKLREHFTPLLKQ